MPSEDADFVALSMQPEDSVFSSGAVAEIRPDSVVLEQLTTPTRYYVAPIALAAVGASYSTLHIYAGVAGVLLGGGAGIALSALLSNRRRSYALEATRDGRREIQTDFVLKKNKVVGVERKPDESPATLEIETPDEVIELSGSEEDIDRVYDALV